MATNPNINLSTPAAVAGTCVAAYESAPATARQVADHLAPDLAADLAAAGLDVLSDREIYVFANAAKMAADLVVSTPTFALLAISDPAGAAEALLGPILCVAGILAASSGFTSTETLARLDAMTAAAAAEAAVTAAAEEPTPA